ncbi:MAG: CPBP family intramembrane metalloprotease [Muribaculaceae bacterium]|nr:CPBP family intramembrane metalloprotease [Muribaculaceae bacterium]
MKNFIDICQFVLVLMGLMICGLFCTSLIGMLPIKGNALQWCLIGGQNILAFILPTILTWKMCFKASPIIAIEADHLPALRMICITLLIYILALPALNQIVYWNQEMTLPDALSEFEEWCRAMEEQAEELTTGLLNSTSLFPTIINILLIGVLTGIGEEFFFRGGLQRMMVWCKVNPHAAIWITATVFSAIHFQFFGFIPRLLLGAFFGYLYWWSGNIWVNSFAHALNNSLVIVSSWCINKGYLSEKFDMFGVSEGGLPVFAIISAILVSAIIFMLCKRGVLVGTRIIPPEIPSKNLENATESK